ncbi:MAG TPA: Gfo/Idh/MocA family oxidoreductase, partial [Ignavibacteriales bacterium]|nr:Gfo/Idh/MocA family oxidoreductase [Ignavibacteriales bacterium]
IARNYHEALSMVETAKKEKRKLMVGMNLRYRPDTMLMKTMIDSGEIGDPFYAKALWIRRQSSSEKWFSKREETGGGVILDLGIHLLDLSLWLLNYPKVKTVQTQNYFHKTKNLEDTSVSFLRCQDSKIINIESSWSLPVFTDSFQLSVYGSKGSITSSPLHIYKRVNEQFIDLRPSITETPSQLFKKSYLNELKSFLGAVKGFNPVLSTGEEAAERLKIIDSMYKSAKKNHEVRVN